MALTETKLLLSRIVLSTAVFISVCVPSSAEEVRRCYWCGPLAEQVHRSQRAPPCNTPYSQVTVCDTGFPYCATVATSPPYMESRYCVKLYQDECYTLYCNSTRTWRMTCPCRGDLCNGPNTDREEDAFAGLAKLVGKTQNTRIKRALISSAGFISMNTNRKNRIDNTTFEENKNSSSNTTGNNNEEINVKTSDLLIDTNTSEADDSNKNTKNQISNMTYNDDDDETSVTAAVEVKNNSQTDNSNVVAEEVVKTNEVQMNETTIKIDIPSMNIESSNLKTEIILMSSEASKTVTESNAHEVPTNIADVQTTTPEVNKQTVIELKVMVDTTTESGNATPTDIIMNKNKMKPTQQLPTAEALQHNETPTTKATEQTTISTTVMSIPHTDVTTEVNRPRNNTAVQLDPHILSLAIGIILQF